MRRDRSGRLRGAALVLALSALPGLGACADRVEAPPPETRADSISMPELPASALTVPVRVALGPLVAELEAAVPRSWGSLDRRLPVPGNDRAEVAIEITRGPLTASLDGSTATVSATLHYRVRTWYDPPVLPEVSASCATGEGDARPRMRVTLQAPIAVDRAWRLATRTEEARVRPLTDQDRDRCEVSFLDIDITDRVAEAGVSLFREHRATLDSIVASADVRSSFREWWSALRRPVPLGTGVWLLLDPRQVRRGAIRGEGAVVEIPVTLLARPRVVLGERPPATEIPLPPLDTAGPDVETGLRVLVEGRARWDSIGTRLRRELDPVTLEGSGRRVRAELVEIAGVGGGRVALEVRIRGDVRARLWLVGTPSYDAETGRVSVPDLEFDVATRNLLLRSSTWLARIGIQRWLRERAEWPAAPAVAWAVDELDRSLDATLAQDVVLRGSLEELRIMDVAAGRDALYVRALLRGEAVLDVGEGA